MSLILWNRISDVIEESLRLSSFTERTQPLGPDADNSLEEIRAIVSPRSTDPCLAEAIWSRAVTHARAESVPEEGWRLFVAWLAWPKLRATAYRISERFRVSRDDADAQLLLGLLDGLKTADVEQPGLAQRLVRDARRQAWTRLRPTFFERVVPDPELLALEASQQSAAGWELYVEPLSDPRKLNAPLRFTVSAAQVEGERLGGLAERLGLRDVVYCARRPSYGTRIGTLSLGRPWER